MVRNGKERAPAPSPGDSKGGVQSLMRRFAVPLSPELMRERMIAENAREDAERIKGPVAVPAPAKRNPGRPRKLALVPGERPPAQAPAFPKAVADYLKQSQIQI